MDLTVTQMRDAIFEKANTKDVKQLETKVLDKLNQIVESLYKKFADKGDTKKNLKILE